jgi:hypothetical protein
MHLRGCSVRSLLGYHTLADWTIGGHKNNASLVLCYANRFISTCLKSVDSPKPHPALSASEVAVPFRLADGLSR